MRMGKIVYVGFVTSQILAMAYRNGITNVRHVKESSAVMYNVLQFEEAWHYVSMPQSLDWSCRSAPLSPARVGS